MRPPTILHPHSPAKAGWLFPAVATLPRCGSAILPRGALIKAKDRVCALIGVHRRGVLFVSFVSEPALFLPGAAPGIPALLPSASLSSRSGLKSSDPGRVLHRPPGWGGGVGLLRRRQAQAQPFFLKHVMVEISAPMLDT